MGGREGGRGKKGVNDSYRLTNQIKQADGQGGGAERRAGRHARGRYLIDECLSFLSSYISVLTLPPTLPSSLRPSSLQFHWDPPHVGSSFPFTQLPDAVRALQTGMTMGKVVVLIDDDEEERGRGGGGVAATK